MPDAWKALNLVFAFALVTDVAVGAPDTPPASARPDARDDELLLCYLDGKKNSLGAMAMIDGKSYRCSTVLEERGVRETAWVQVRMIPSIVVE